MEYLYEYKINDKFIYFSFYMYNYIFKLYLVLLLSPQKISFIYIYIYLCLICSNIFILSLNIHFNLLKELKITIK